MAGDCTCRFKPLSGIKTTAHGKRGAVVLTVEVEGTRPLIRRGVLWRALSAEQGGTAIGEKGPRYISQCRKWPG